MKWVYIFMKITQTFSYSQYQTSYLSLASLARLVEKKFAMWRNFTFPYVTIAEKFEITPHVETFDKSPYFHVEKIETTPHVEIF